MPTRLRRGFTLLEVALASVIFVLLSIVLFMALRETSRVWRKSSARDDALAQILRAKARLTQDLANASTIAGQFATASVGPNLGTGKDGDALTFLSSDDGKNTQQWNLDATGAALMRSQITYYLTIPKAENPFHLNPSAGAADANGYEQQHPCKWLVRRVDPVAPGPSLDPIWQTWLTPLTSPDPTEDRQVVATQLLGFRILPLPAPRWSLEISAVAIADATRQVAVGTVPLTGSPYTLVEQFAVRPGN